MNIDSSYTNVQNIYDLQSTSLEKLGSALAINKASDDASGLAIANALGAQKSELSQSIENMNSGIAMSNIAQDGISKQKEILENIKIETLKAMNGTTSQEGREVIAKQISKYIDQYESIASSTSYNDTSLLKTDGSSEDDISIADGSSNIDMEKADTTSISDGLRTFLNDFPTNSSSMQNMMTAIDQGITKLATYASDFGSAANAMESSAKNSILTEVETAKAQSTILDIDYSKEVSDFSKTNIMTQIGYLMQTQANAQQQRNIDILS
jgi:flagellin